MLSMLLMFIDVRYLYLESARSALSVLLTPVQRLAAMPEELWNYAGNIFITQSEQHKLMEDNEALKLQHQNDGAQLSRLQTLELENQHFRKLNALPQRHKLAVQLAEIVYAEKDVFRRRVLVSKGAGSDIRIGQVVMDDAGIVGQITRVYPGLSEVTLITEKDHAVPVQIVRNGLRTIIFGSGDISHLSLRYIPVDADVEEGDILATSGIDGIYPQGIPVAQVVKVERNSAYPFADVTCMPLAGVDRHRHLLILSDLPNMPERPVQAADSRAKERKYK